MTNTVLHIDASARTQDSLSRQLSARAVAQQDASEIIRRDLNEGLPFLTEDWAIGTFTPAENRSAAQIEALTLSDQLVEEIQRADTIVIGTPIYNFSIPAVLKAWIDQIARAGVTFQYGENGPEGLLKNKKVVVTVSSGGTVVGSDYDLATPYLKLALGFLGITDVTFLVKADLLSEAA